MLSILLELMLAFRFFLSFQTLEELNGTASDFEMVMPPPVDHSTVSISLERNGSAAYGSLRDLERQQRRNTEGGNISIASISSGL
jgi:hypothetical protein